MLFIPQYNLSYSDKYSRWCGHHTHYFHPHSTGKNIVTWIIPVQGLAGVLILHYFRNRGEQIVDGGQSASLPCLTFQCCTASNALLPLLSLCAAHTYSRAQLSANSSTFQFLSLLNSNCSLFITFYQVTHSFQKIINYSPTSRHCAR